MMSEDRFIHECVREREDLARYLSQKGFSLGELQRGLCQDYFDRGIDEASSILERSVVL